MIELVTIKNKIEQLSKKQQIEVLKIITNLDISYSENNNGVFFNLSNFSEAQLSELNDYISYVSDQEEALQELENVKNELSETFFSNKKNNIKENAANIIDA
jgi:dsDNA-specific endonuclease/ATPase MutS2